MDDHATSTKRILLVDDDPHLLEVLAIGLNVLGHFEVLSAAHGIAGLEVIQSTPVACIVIDALMPGLNGYQLVRALRGDPTTMNIPIIMLTALIQDTDEVAGMLTGVDAYLRKPVDLHVLIATINQIITLSSAQRDQREQDLSEGHWGNRTDVPRF
jgi:DNA-binding response OmpR family regulator